MPLNYDHPKINKNFTILVDHYGQLNLILNNQCIDADGNELPWYTYPSIEFLNGIDLSNESILEYGSANSTIYWPQKSLKITSIEDNSQ